MFSVSAMTLLLRSVPAQLRGRASGTFQSGFLLGGMAGPALGSLLARISLTAPFFFYAATLAVAGMVGLFLLRPPAHGQSSRGSGSTTVRTALADAGYRAACMANFAQGWNSFGVRSSLVPILVVESLNRSPADAGIAFAIAAVAQTLALGPAGRFVDTTGRRPALVIGGIICGLSIGATPWVDDLTMLTVVMVVYGLGSSLLGTAPAAAVGDVVGPKGGQPVAVFSMMSDIGGILGPLLAGLLADLVSMQLAFAIGAGFAILASLMATRMARAYPDHRPHSRADPEGAAMPKPLTDLMAPDWAQALEPVADRISAMGDFLRDELAAGRSYLPAGENVLRAFRLPLQQVRVLIVGQDPYPTPGHPVGLSFSVAPQVRPLPKSLVNIYRELHDDLGLAPAASGDLTPWFDQGVLLLNRVLTVAPGKSASHRGKGWEAITQCAIEALVNRGRPLVAVLWGRDAQSLIPQLGEVPYVKSPHPSPLSAHHGFFGSKPFSRVNALLTEAGAEPIDWRLD